MYNKEKQLKQQIKELNKNWDKYNQNIINLNKKKYTNFKNNFFKILSFNFYNWNKKINFEIQNNKLKIQIIKEKILNINKILLKNNIKFLIMKNNYYKKNKYIII